MNPAVWGLAVLGWIAVDAAIVLLLARRAHPPREGSAWFDHERFVNDALAARVKAYSRPPVIAHPCSYGGDLVEYPVASGWDEDAILTTLAEIEAL